MPYAPAADFDRLCTERLALRRFRDSDLDAFVAYRSEPDVARYQSWSSPYPRAAGRALLADMAARHPDTPGSWYQIAVADRVTDALLGDLALHTGVDPRLSTIGFTMAPANQGRGYASEAARELLRWLFEERAKHRVQASCDARNERSAALLARLGFTREGLLRENLFDKGAWTSELVFGFLRSEWPRPG